MPEYSCICGPVGQTLHRTYKLYKYDAAKTRVIIIIVAYIPLLIGRICFGDQNTIATAISQAMKSSRYIRSYSGRGTCTHMHTALCAKGPTCMCLLLTTTYQVLTTTLAQRIIYCNRVYKTIKTQLMKPEGIEITMIMYFSCKTPKLLHCTHIADAVYVLYGHVIMLSS